nr:MAG TPA: YopX protein [Caudoviricetes sp.]
MREILFKGKRIDNGEWVVGQYVNTCYPGNGKETGHFIVVYPNKYHEIYTSTLCQFTGLCDKNGKKIWENDICDRKEKYPEVVKMANGDWTLDYSYAIGRDYGNSYCNLGFYVNERKCVEVIGNIFDNPELLQEEHK